MTTRDRGLEEARRLLKSKKISSSNVSPAELVRVAGQINKSLDHTLNLIAFLRMSGQGYGPFPRTAKLLTGEYQ